MSSSWKYYNHSMRATGAPGELPDLQQLSNGSLWKHKGYPLFAIWTSDYDCSQETEWWYCIKDSKYDISSLNSKKRYRITRGRREFSTEIISAEKYLEEIVQIQISAYKKYPSKYRPSDNPEELKRQVLLWNKQSHRLFGAFSKETNELVGYALINEFDNYLYYVQQKVIPDFEKKEINAALVDAVLSYYDGLIAQGMVLVDGQRNIIHETAFQEYLCKYFGFRKAYCRLNVKYRNWVRVLVSLLFPFRKCIYEKRGKMSHMISGVLKIEEIRRSFKGDQQWMN